MQGFIQQRGGIMALPKAESYTIDDIYALPEGHRAELIDGRMYDMAAPGFAHQKLVHLFDRTIGNYIDTRGGACEVLPAPFAVFLNADDKNYVEPDLSVICDRGKIDERGCNGAPDWIIEITSPSDPQRDYGIKLFKYRTAGVREYWIVNPQKKTVTVFDFENDLRSNQYNWDEDVPGCIFEDLTINIDKLYDRRQ